MALQSCSISPMNSFLNQVYYIPSYQREYSWQDPEIEDLWDDIQATIDGNDINHFFGQIVVHSDDANRRKYIIDGQQRTITSMIFMRVLQVYYAELYRNNSNLRKASYKENDIASIHLGREDNIHLHLSNPDDDSFFRDQILFGLPQDKKKQKKKSYTKMMRAYTFFYSEIAKKLDDCISDEEKMDILNIYYDTFTIKFNVLYMEATKLEEAFVIFETLNARGRDLETSDLLKNFIFSQSRNVSEAQREWDHMMGVLDQADPTKYIRYFWNSSHEFTREKELYRSISKTITTPRGSAELLNSLNKCAQWYHDILNPFDAIGFTNQELIGSLRSLKLLKATTFYPIVLAVQQSSEIKDEEKESFLAGIVQIVEVYVFRNIICGINPNKAEKVFGNLAKDIYDGKLSTLDQIKRCLEKNIVDDENFCNNFKIWTGSNASKDTIRYILRKIHKYYDKSNELNIDNSEVHIEHIMPQDASGWDVSDEIHDSYLWRLGNLALLSGKFNKAISNLPFAAKKKVYAESKIDPNYELPNKSEWTPKEIEERQKKFAEIALEIWPK